MDLNTSTVPLRPMAQPSSPDNITEITNDARHKLRMEEAELDEMKAGILIKTSINKESYCKLDSSLIKKPE